MLIFQMPVGRINNIMTSNSSWKDIGLGTSGETYLVGEDYTLRNQSRFLIESKEEYLDDIRKSGVSGDIIRQIDKLDNSIGLQLVKTKGAIAALNGETGEEVFDDYRGVPVLSAYRPLQLNGLKWVILCEIDEAEALAPLQRIRIRFLIIFLISIPLVIVIAFYFSRSLTKRLDGLTNVAKEFANGNMDVALGITGKDEIGSLAASLGKMRDSIHDLLDKQEKTIEALSASLIPVSDDIGVMSLIGVFDEHRLDVVRRNITSELDARFRKVVILDLTGILEIDRSTGDGLFKITKAVKLMGSKVIITGVRPDMAIDMTELDIDSSDVLTETNLQSGIEKGMKLVAS